MINLKKLLILFALMSVSLGSNAAVIDLDFGMLSPGDSSNVTFENITAGMHDVELAFEIAGAPAGGVQAVGGTFTFGGPNGSIIINGAELTSNIVGFTPIGINFQNVLGGAVAVSSFDEQLLSGSYLITLNIEAFGTNADIDGQIDVAAVPLPAAVWLFGSALVGLIGLRRSDATIV
jgi:hypothetical protein